MTVSIDSLDPADLRALIRQVLSDELSGTRNDPADVPAGGAVASDSDTTGDVAIDVAPRQVVESVSLRNDVELQAFVLRILSMVNNPKQRADLKDGRIKFVLTAGSQAGRTAPSRRIEKGAVTEVQVKDAASVGASLLLGRKAVLTPLARDKARSLGVVVERES